MMTAADRIWPGAGPGAHTPAADAALFALIDELRRSEKHRDLLLERLAAEDGDRVEAAARQACDEARALYRRIAAITPTTAAGVLRQLELTAHGWVAPAAVPAAMAALREIARRPPPLKVGKLPPVPRPPQVIDPVRPTGSSAP